VNIIPWTFDWRDAQFFQQISDNTYFTWFASRKPHPESAKSEKWRAWVVRDDDGRLVGWAHYEGFDNPRKAHVASLGVAIAPDARGKGIGYELSRYVVERGRGAGYRKLWATYHADNAAMARIYERLGFHIEGRFEDEEKWGGQYKDIVSVALFLERTMHCEGE